MARDYVIDGEVADADFLSPAMNSNYWSMLLSSIRFYSDEYVTQVTPTSGQVRIMLSADGVNFNSVSSGQFNAADAYNPDRTKPNALGVATKALLTLSGVTGATHFRAIISRTA